MSISLRQPCDEALLRAPSAGAPCEPAAGRWILAATILASSMAFIDGTVVNVALPALQSDLHATVTQVQWVVEAYSLFLSAFLLLGGSLGDHYGRRRFFLFGVAIFNLGSIGCGLAPGIMPLILARGMQGIGGALLVPGSLAIISASFSEAQRGRAIGTWSGFTAITAAIGPLLGGWLIEQFSWRAIFFLNLPLALAVVWLSLRHLPESRDESEQGQLDWIGALLTVMSLGGIIYGLIESSRLGFAHPFVWGALGGGLVLAVCFMAWEGRATAPMLPFALFRSRNFSGANLLTLLLYAALGGTLFFLPLNLIQVQGYSPPAAGAALLPFILLMFFLSRWGGGLVERYGARWPLVIGPLITSLGFALFLRPGVGGTYWQTFFPAVVVLGIGMAASVAPLTTTVMNSTAANRVGIASGINNMVARAAGLFAIAVFGVVMIHTFDRDLTQRSARGKLSPEAGQILSRQRSNLAAVEFPPEIDAATRRQMKEAVDAAFVSGFRAVMLIGCGLAVSSALVALLLIRGDGQRVRAR
jgi:EmrB/QacA subfamily drug resistance transporter